ncbi:unnamed protein product [Rhizoctonia solani]|uniref:Uncharacterized protein n=1 Tax=Rhizoctonia solani TaxID=456999 RepID=A0A8H3CDW5_9AGAM|nr:unnamed protein product [Rhizoctonia solani]
MSRPENTEADKHQREDKNTAAKARKAHPRRPRTISLNARANPPRPRSFAAPTRVQQPTLACAVSLLSKACHEEAQEGGFLVERKGEPPEALQPRARPSPTACRKEAKEDDFPVEHKGEFLKTSQPRILQLKSNEAHACTTHVSHEGTLRHLLDPFGAPCGEPPHHLAGWRTAEARVRLEPSNGSGW